MLDMERARMTAEDYRQGNAVMDRWVDSRGNEQSVTWRRVEDRREVAVQLIATMLDVVKQSETRQTDASGRPLTGEDYFAQIRAAVQAHDLSIESGAEISDEESSDEEMSDEEEVEEVQCVLCHIMIGRHVVMADQPGRWAGLAYHDRIVCRQCYDADPEVHRMDEELARTANDAPVYCEACDAYYRQGVVAWYREPFMHDGRNLYSACWVCRQNLNLEDRPVLHW